METIVSSQKEAKMSNGTKMRFDNQTTLRLKKLGMKTLSIQKVLRVISW